MTTVAEEVAAIEEDLGWESLFREIKSTSALYDLPCTVARLQENRNRNRYRDVSPYDHSRVKLVAGENDYINGNLVIVQKADRRYILCQGPLPATSGHMWQMVWEQNSKSVIMLNKVIEKGTRKCDQYWPLDINHPMIFEEDGFKVSLISETDKDNFVIRKLQLVNLEVDEEPRIIIQFHYTAWPDFGVPESPTAFLDFLACVRQYQVLEKQYGPAVIHCSAGIGRSGTFALVDTCLVYLERGVKFDIRETLLDMRRYRMGLIQTPYQLRFSYLAVAECERVLHEDVTPVDDVNSDEEDCGKDNNEPSGSNGDYKKKSDDESHDKEDDEEISSRKRHGEPNGPSEEKRGKQEEIRNNSSSSSQCHLVEEDKLPKDLNNTLITSSEITVEDVFRKHSVQFKNDKQKPRKLSDEEYQLKRRDESNRSYSVSEGFPESLLSKKSQFYIESALGMKTSDTKFPIDHPVNSIPSPLHVDSSFSSSIFFDNNNSSDGLRKRPSKEVEELQQQVDNISNVINSSDSEMSGSWRPWKHYMLGGFTAVVLLGIGMRYWYNN